MQDDPRLAIHLNRRCTIEIPEILKEIIQFDLRIYIFQVGWEKPPTRRCISNVFLMETIRSTQPWDKITNPQTYRFSGEKGYWGGPMEGIVTIVRKLVDFTCLRDENNLLIYRGYNPVTKYRQDIPVVHRKPIDLSFGDCF